MPADPFVHTHGEHKASELSRDVDIAPEDFGALSASSKSVEQFVQELPQALIDWANDAKENSGAVRAGTLLRTIRTNAGLSQTALGEQTQIKQADISALETGSGERGPTFDVLARVAEACGYRLTFAPKIPAPSKMRTHMVVYTVTKPRKKKPEDTFVTYLETKFHYKPKGKAQHDLREMIAKVLGRDVNSVSLKTLDSVTSKLKKNRSFMSYIQNDPKAGRVLAQRRAKTRHLGRAGASSMAQAVKSR
ncbi:MAG: helix-turn-helix transcriptional regulator [Pseudomonadota bacterium]